MRQVADLGLARALAVETDPVVNDQRETIARLSRQLEKMRLGREQLVAAVYAAVKDGISGLTLPPVKGPPKQRKGPSEEVAVAILSDWQLGKRTPSYTSDVCAQRVDLYADKVMALTAIQRADHPVRHLRVWVLGDIIEGVTIFPGQHWLVDAGLYRQITVDGPRIMCGFLRRMLTEFESVHVSCVIGNHGRLGRRGDYDPETNGDRMLYRICQQLMASEERITWTIPDGPGERNWYAIDDIGGYRTLLVHGDQFRGTSGMPWYSLQKKVGGWKMGALAQGFDDVAFGHYHQPTRITLNTVTARCSGSTESHNDYAAEQLAAVGRPSQWLLFVRAGRGVTAEYVVWLDGETTPERTK